MITVASHPPDLGSWDQDEEMIKNFVDPEELQRRLRRLGWECVICRDGHDWVCGQARPLT